MIRLNRSLEQELFHLQEALPACSSMAHTQIHRGRQANSFPWQPTCTFAGKCHPSKPEVVGLPHTVTIALEVGPVIGTYHPRQKDVARGAQSVGIFNKSGTRHRSVLMAPVPGCSRERHALLISLCCLPHSTHRRCHHLDLDLRRSRAAPWIWRLSRRRSCCSISSA